MFGTARAKSINQKAENWVRLATKNGKPLRDDRVPCPPDLGRRIHDGGGSHGWARTVSRGETRAVVGSGSTRGRPGPLIIFGTARAEGIHQKAENRMSFYRPMQRPSLDGCSSVPATEVRPSKSSANPGMEGSRNTRGGNAALGYRLPAPETIVPWPRLRCRSAWSKGRGRTIASGSVYGRRSASIPNGRGA